MVVAATALARCVAARQVSFELLPTAVGASPVVPGLLRGAGTVGPDTLPVLHLGGASCRDSSAHLRHRPRALLGRDVVQPRVGDAVVDAHLQAARALGQLGVVQWSWRKPASAHQRINLRPPVERRRPQLSARTLASMAAVSCRCWCCRNCVRASCLRVRCDVVVCGVWCGVWCMRHTTIQPS